MMERNWHGLDFLRGLGIFFLLVMHSAFYYFDGLWDLDLENPPLIITVIGFLLMFAGLFAIISGAVHGISIYRLHQRQGWSLKQIAIKKLSSSAFILAVAYVYFIFTGPGLAEFANRRMNNSVLVEWIRNGRWAGINPERVLYVDSLVMIGCNVLLVSLIWIGLLKINRLTPGILILSSGSVMILSLLRLPLYPYYLEQVSRGHWVQTLLLNWLVNKNNPVLPFLAFGLLGSWLGLRLELGRSRKPALFLGIGLFVIGMVLYIFLPDTMLQRAIDMKWYSIMIAQLGIFILLFLASISIFDQKGKKRFNGWLYRFFRRFGYAGLTAFFLESVVSAVVWRILTAMYPNLQLDIGGALLFGVSLAILWGFALTLWEKYFFAGTIEYFYTLFVIRFGQISSKALKLSGGGDESAPKPG